MRYLIAILLALQIALSVRWDGPGRATVSWSGPGCLYRNQTLIACFPRDASYVIELGGPSTDAAYRPASGDVYRLVRDGQEVARAGIRSVVYLAVWRQ